VKEGILIEGCRGCSNILLLLIDSTVFLAKARDIEELPPLSPLFDTPISNSPSPSPSPPPNYLIWLIPNILVTFLSQCNGNVKPLCHIYNTNVCAGIAIYSYFNHKMDITIEFTFKKTLTNIYNIYVCAGIAIYGYSDHKTNITI
jgi:hypothetical protein